jgi:hypothetical protein
VQVPYGLGCIYYVVDLEGPVDIKLLTQAATLSVKKHPNLRSTVSNR